jgi:hypothetical protein
VQYFSLDLQNEVSRPSEKYGTFNLLKLTFSFILKNCNDNVITLNFYIFIYI